MKKIFFLLAILLALTTKALATSEDINISWWEKFKDDNLKEDLLILSENNYDLKNASLIVEQNKQLTKMQLAQELPFAYFSADLNRDLQGARQQFGQMSIPKYSQYNYYIPLTMAYELDIWGLNHFKTKSIKQLETISLEAKRASYITQSSDFALDYFNLIKANEFLVLQDEIIKTQKEILNKTKEKYKIGLCDINSVLEEENILNGYIEEKNTTKNTQKALREKLKVYLSTYEDDIKINTFDKVTILKDIPSEYSSQIIENRPDYKQQEAYLKKIGFDISALKREFLPKFLITGQIGLNAYHLDSLFNSASQLFNLGIAPSWDIFSGGRKLANLKLKKYEYEACLNDYQKTMLNGIKEVNSSLFEYNSAIANLDKTLERLNNQNKIHNLALDKSKIGASSTLDTLYSKKALLNIKKEYVSNKINVITTIITLYKASGGVDLYKLADNNL